MDGDFGKLLAQVDHVQGGLVEVVAVVVVPFVEKISRQGVAELSGVCDPTSNFSCIKQRNYMLIQKFSYLMFC